MRIKSIYAMYKGEEYLGEGTIEELAKCFNVNPRTIKFYLTPTYSKRGSGEKGNRRKLVRVCYINE